MVWIACTVIGSHLLNRKLPQRDRLLFPLALLMSGWGLVLIERLAPNFADRQVVWLAVSVAALLGIVYTPRILRVLRGYRYILLLIGLGAAAGDDYAGHESLRFARRTGIVAGIRRVLLPALGSAQSDSGGVSGELSRRAVPGAARVRSGAAAGSAIDPRRFSPRIVGPVVLMWGLSVVILIWQRDLGTAILFFMVFLVLLYVASGYTPLLIVGALLIIAAGFVAYRLFDVVSLRVDIWLNPWPEADNRAFQIVQSLLAFAAGGVFGQGVGQGSPYYIPVVHSDFVFAALAEEWGLLGVVVVIALIAVFVVRGLRIAVIQQTRPFHALLAVGLSIMLATQSLLIMGGVLKLIPLTGVTLPYFSYGGSSLLVNFIMVGLLLRLSAGEN